MKIILSTEIDIKTEFPCKGRKRIPPEEFVERASEAIEKELEGLFEGRAEITFGKWGWKRV